MKDDELATEVNTASTYFHGSFKKSHLVEARSCFGHPFSVWANTVLLLLLLFFVELTILIIPITLFSAF